MNNKISVITSFYNAESYIDYALVSISKQITNDGEIYIEYILVNDCSTDNSLDKVKEFLLRFNNPPYLDIKLFNLEENVGCGAARKYGIDHATGNYFMFLDADDYYINDDFILRAYKTTVDEDADIIEYGVLYNDPNGKKINMTIPQRCIFNSCEDSIYWMFKNNTIKFNVWSKIYTRAIVESYPYDTTREYEDIRTVPIWIKNANKIIVEPSLEINYRASQKSIIRDDGLKTRLGTITAMTEMCELFKDNIKIVKALYDRASIDLCAVMENKTSLDEGFDEMSKLNTKLLSYIYPDTYKDITYNVPENNNGENTILNSNENNNEENKNISIMI